MGNFPRTEKEARYRSERKLKALERAAKRALYDIAGFWDEGPISADVDRLLEDIDRGIDAIRESMDEEITCHQEET